jgi:class 3 adenylate cyclase
VSDESPKANVLVVDDRPEDLALVRAYLNGPDYAIVTARDGDDALLKLAQTSFDLVILDVDMPGRNGFEVCRFLRGLEETKDLSVLLLTSLNEVADRVKGIECGADEFLSKPVDRAELRTRVKALLKAKFYRQQILEKNALLEQVLSRWHSEDVVARIKDDAGLLKLGGERKHVTVLFADLRGFTHYSESVSPEAAVDTLNQAFGRLAKLVGDNHGTFDKYTGDGLMAFYGAPLSFGNDAANAVRTAVQMQKAFEALKLEWGDGARAGLGLAIGLNSGEVVVGNVGSETLMSYTVIGDAVNVAARIQTEAEDGQVLMGEATFELVSGIAVARRTGEATLRGRLQPVAIFELVRLFTPA